MSLSPFLAVVAPLLASNAPEIDAIALKAAKHSASAVAGRVATSKFAACVATRAPIGSDTLVRSEPGTHQESAAFAALSKVITWCDRRSRRSGDFPGRAIFRGAVAERLWLDRGVWDWSGSNRVSPDHVDFDIGFEATPALKGNYRMAFCVAYTAPDRVDALLRTRLGSAAEAAAFSAVSQPLSACVGKGEIVSLDRTLTRALLAEQLYRHYPAPQQPRSRANNLLNPKN
jgi:hypothetical protein